MDKKKLINRLCEDVDNFIILMKEGYSYGDMGDNGDEYVANGQEDLLMDDNDEQEDADYSQDQQEDTISKIRSLALQGIQDYAEDVDSKEYEFFKKIWLMCDKVCSEKETDSKEDY